MVHVIGSALRASGLSVKFEPRPFVSLDPSVSEEDRRKRPDLQVTDLGTNKKPLLLDISLTRVHPSPLSAEGQEFTKAQARIQEFFSSKRANEKLSKYNQLSSTCGYKFQPIIIETTGRIMADHWGAIEYLLESGIKGGYKDGFLLRRYWKRRISFTFQKAVAHAMFTKLCTLKRLNQDSRDIYNPDLIHLLSTNDPPLH